MASSIRRIVFVVLVSALLANALPFENQQMDDEDDSFQGELMLPGLADSSSYETVKRSSVPSNENESDMPLRNDEHTRNKILAQKLSNILKELKQAKLTKERESLRDLIFNKHNLDNQNAEASSAILEESPVESLKKPESKIYKGNFQKK